MAYKDYSLDITKNLKIYYLNIQLYSYLDPKDLNLLLIHQYCSKPLKYYCNFIELICVWLFLLDLWDSLPSRHNFLLLLKILLAHIINLNMLKNCLNSFFYKYLVDINIPRTIDENLLSALAPSYILPNQE